MVALTGVELADLGPVDIKSQAGESGMTEGSGQRQADITHAHDADPNGVLLNGVQPLPFRKKRTGRPWPDGGCLIGLGLSSQPKVLGCRPRLGDGRRYLRDSATTLSVLSARYYNTSRTNPPRREKAG
jgi:hypothetical protein